MNNEFDFQCERIDEYTIYSNKNNTVHTLIFKDAENKTHKIEITEELKEFFISEKKILKSQKNKFDRHIEHSEIYENNLNKRAMNKSFNLEDEVIRKTTFEKLKKAIEKLPEKQKARIKKYYFEDKNINQIAREENTTKQAISSVLERAIKNLKKILEKI